MTENKARDGLVVWATGTGSGGTEAKISREAAATVAVLRHKREGRAEEAQAFGAENFPRVAKTGREKVRFLF